MDKQSSYVPVKKGMRTKKRERSRVGSAKPEDSPLAGNVVAGEALVRKRETESERGSRVPTKRRASLALFPLRPSLQKEAESTEEDIIHVLLGRDDERKMSKIPGVLLFLGACCVLGVSCGSCREAKLCCSGRDSSCVVQKAPLNAIIEDLNDKPCYCDHACLKLGDCCTDFKEACGVVDCQVTQWGPWTSCDTECGSGTMSRTRSIKVQPQNGGKHCPSLEQRRGCQVSNCHHHPDPAIKEIAMLLPGSLSHTRTANNTNDIRNNLGLRDPSENPQYDPEKTYCVEFEVLKASKGCRKDETYKALKEGERVCVLCESEALHESLGWRCQGHGVEGRVTRWSALSAPNCHGKWLRAHAEPEKGCSTRTCKGKKETAFIFV